MKHRLPDGPGITLAIAGGVFAFWLLIQTLAGAVMVGVYDGQPPFGWFATVTLWAATPLTLILLLAFVRWRGGPGALRRRLGFEPSAWKPALVWSAITVATVLVGEALRLALGKPVVPEFLQEAWATSGPVPLFVIAFVILPPLFEETLFRGWMIPGLAASPLGNVGAVVVSSILFAAVHLQYDLVDMTVVFALGLALGGARVATGSVWPSMVLHGVVNGAAVVQVAVTS